MIIYELKTNATNRRIREIITAIRNKTLIARPDFQRRLVWTNRDRVAFIDTILSNLPFPEIYVCAGEVNPETAQGTEWLVDGQQRISAIVSYFSGDAELRLGTTNVPPYAKLSDEQKRQFLEYTVVVRDLGAVPVDYVKTVFQKINSTKYGLNAMELANARYDGAIKKAAEKLSEHPFFGEHSVFTPSDIRRMGDMSFQLTMLVTMEQGYFDDTDEHESYLERYNDAYPNEVIYLERLDRVFDLINRLGLSVASRWWKKADIFSLIVELDTALHVAERSIVAPSLARSLVDFEEQLRRLAGHELPQEFDVKLREELSRYALSAAQGSNHRKSRVARGEIIARLIADASSDDGDASQAP